MIQETLIPRLCTLCTTVPVIAPKERLRGYRRYVYEADAVDRSETGQRKVIKEVVVEKERKKEFKISRVDRFRYRTRYFTDSGIIGTKEFVSINYVRFKDIFMSKRERGYPSLLPVWMGFTP